MKYLGSSIIDSENITSGVKRFSCQARGLEELYEDFINTGILKEKIDNFGRLSEESKKTVFSVGLALHDAGIAWGERRKNIAVIAADQDCCQRANFAYFRDYAAHGRTIGRGNLFVSTLPTAPGAMAGIACGLHGPLYFCSFSTDEQIGPALEEAEMLLEQNEATEVVSVLSDDDVVASFVFRKGRSGANCSRLNTENGIATFWESINCAARGTLKQ